MSLLYNNIAVFDFETSSVEHETTQPLSLACVMVEPKGPSIVKGSEFYTLIQPEDEKTVEAEALAVNKLTLAELKQAPTLEVAWKSFDTYLQKYRKGKGKSLIHPGGFNITNFDIPIYKRLNKRFKYSDVFNFNKPLDLFNDFFRWFHNDDIKFMNLDVIREMMGYSKELSHNALGDCQFCAELTVRMLGLYRRIKPKFQDCMK